MAVARSFDLTAKPYTNDWYTNISKHPTPGVFIRFVLNEASSEDQLMALAINEIHCGNSRQLIGEIEPDSIACSVWSPPYYVGKDYEKHLT